MKDTGLKWVSQSMLMCTNAHVRSSTYTHVGRAHVQSLLALKWPFKDVPSHPSFFLILRQYDGCWILSKWGRHCLPTPRCYVLALLRPFLSEWGRHHCSLQWIFASQDVWTKGYILCNTLWHSTASMVRSFLCFVCVILYCAKSGYEGTGRWVGQGCMMCI